MYYVYILVSKVDSSLYTGQTDKLLERIKRHDRGFVKVTMAKRPYELGYFESFPTRREAMWKEWQLKKQWNTERKKKLVASFDVSKMDTILGR